MSHTADGLFAIRVRQQIIVGNRYVQKLARNSHLSITSSVPCLAAVPHHSWRRFPTRITILIVRVDVNVAIPVLAQIYCHHQYQRNLREQETVRSRLVIRTIGAVRIPVFDPRRTEEALIYRFRNLISLLSTDETNEN